MEIFEFALELKKRVLPEAKIHMNAGKGYLKTGS
jgi:hypothetical protein